MKKNKKILVMGLPGSGTSYLADKLTNILGAEWLNADRVREASNDWDFSPEGRTRQAERMKRLAQEGLDRGKHVIADFVCPTQALRDEFKGDYVIWMNTIKEGRFEDTNKMFTAPDVYDFRITEQAAEKWAEFVGEHIIDNQRRPQFDWQKETVQMLGRWQPWHAGHRALFERAVAKTGQVVIQIRDCQGWQGSNPFAIDQVKNLIRRDLDPIYQGQYEIQVVPNIVNITYGRDVGYRIEQESFDESVTAISGTKIRRSMGLE
jgi:adenylate kinase family enzyme